jgi:peroxiredoxin
VLDQVSSLKEGFETFQELGAGVLAVSSDSLESHGLFCERLGGLPSLGSDRDLTVAKAYGVADDSGRRRGARYSSSARTAWSSWRCPITTRRTSPSSSRFSRP